MLNLTNKAWFLGNTIDLTPDRIDFKKLRMAFIEKIDFKVDENIIVTANSYKLKAIKTPQASLREASEDRQKFIYFGVGRQTGSKLYVVLIGYSNMLIIY